MPAPLPTLRERLRRQQRRWRRSHERWQKTRKPRFRRAARRQARAIKRIKAQIQRRRPASGTGPWGGSESIIVNEVLPVGRRWRITVTSTKRRETFGNPGSDHYVGNKTAYAVDFATDSNYDFGKAVGRSLGVPYNGKGDDYKNFYILRNGRQFRVQLICSTHGSGPHTHVGVRRV
jgi:hypothetical protein